MKLKIENGRKLDQHGNLSPINLAIDSGKIIEVSRKPIEFKADQVIDAKDAYVLPGLVDLSVALREPGYPVKGSIYSETKAAAAGGVTTLCSEPDTDPVNDSAAVSKLIEELAHRSHYCRVLPIGALTQGLQGELLSEYGALKAAGCIALGNSNRATKTLSVMKRCFEYAKTQNMRVFINPTEPSLSSGAMHEGIVSTTLGLPGIPSVGEAIAVSNLIMLAEETGVQLHIAQVSAAKSVALIEQAKKSGLSITAGVAVQNLVYSEEDIAYFDSQYHCLPPLRSEDDRRSLLEGVRSGTIDTISSAHRPHEAAAKQMPFAETEPGMSSVELLLPMGILLEDRGDLPFVSFLKAVTTSAAAVIDPAPINVEVGDRADLCLFDPKLEWVVTEDSLLSTGKNTPLLGTSLRGRVINTIYDGAVSYCLNTR